MTVQKLYEQLNIIIPASLSCEWDNDGLMCCPDSAREVRRALVCLDVTADAIEKAVAEGCDVIVSHHPLIFKGLKSITDESFIPQKAITLIRAGISVMSFHTRLDALDGGVNDTLAKLLSLSDVAPFGDGIGRIGSLDAPCDIESFVKKVKTALGAPTVQYADAKKAVQKVAVLGGSGKDELFAAIAAGADTFVSGELSHHPMTDAPDMKINLVEAGHFYTEEPVCEVICQMLADLGIEAIHYTSNKIKVI